MKFTVIRSRFLELLSSVQSVVPNKPALQIISNAMVDAQEDGTLTLTATDLDVSVRSTLSADVKVDEPGAVTLPVRKLIEVLRNAPEGEVSFSIGDDNVANVLTAAAKYKLIGLDVREFPVITEPSENVKRFTIDRAVFREMLRKTAYAAGTDETRRTLTGVLLQFKDSTLTMVATDGKRLALVSQEVDVAPEGECAFILPPKAVAELMRLLTGEGAMQIVGQFGQILFDCGTFKFYSKLIEGAYARYEAVIPAEKPDTKRVTVNREDVITSIKRVAIMSNEKTYAVRLQFKPGELTLEANNNDAGEASDVLPIKYTGEEFVAKYNPTYILECLTTLDTEEVIFELTKSNAPAVIKCENVPFVYVVMPLRIPV